VNTVATVATLILACNAPRRRVALSVDDSRIVAIGAVLTGMALVVIGAIATPVLDALDVSAPNTRIAAGVLIAVVSLHDVVRRPPPRGAALTGLRAAIVPVFFPVLFRPEVALVALVIGADHGVAATVVGATLAMGVVVGWHVVAAARREHPVFLRVERGIGIVDAALAAALGIALTADGVFGI
jgi:small neutral amino acid transporter SnatA (MarC family)